MTKENNETELRDEWIGFGDVSTQQHTNKAISVHVPAKARDMLNITPRIKAYVEVNPKRRMIRYKITDEVAGDARKRKKRSSE